ncbi:type III secretion system cytoplasmic ring protein SctQ [Pseudoduganella chitinolytica]|uniref:Type III secretion system cytoplasmic ring protein SctQ n=1 Tax=Pseudoduganella chitinolytica TaxID=34070 RepID=A0ABY8B8U0_9BURK|nr:type III secretion system cytoplasmic ring protein SctQ [Pseudoduganella chitinolytica]WEF32230.1 type III secretion system cytoplasmic ring protein SctQ [Pseudoduganella chitinolytica]
MPIACLPGLPGDAAGYPPRSLLRAEVTADHAALTRRVGRGLRLPLADGVTLHVAFTAEQGTPDADAVALDGPPGRLALHAGVPFLLALTGIDVAAFDAAPAAQREWLAARLLGRLAGTPLAAMTLLLRPPPAVAPGVATPGVATLHLSLQDGSHAVGTPAQADAATWLSLLAAHPFQPVQAPPAPFLALTVRAPARIARHALAPAVLRTLLPGDVIVPARPDVDVDGVGWLRCAGRLARVRYGHTGTVEFLSLESAMETEHEAPMPAQLDVAPPDLDRTPLQLEFRLGALALTLGQLRTLAPGAIFQLDGAADGAVAIVAGGQRLGEGEAVDVAGRLGIRITRWDVPC